MVKTKRIAITLALGILLVLFSTAFATAPAKARMSRTASAPTTSQQVPAVWSGWGEVPGNGSTLSGPATTYNGNEYVFVRGTNNRIYMNASNGTTWSGWREVPGHGLTPSTPAVRIPTMGASGSLDLFVRGTDNKIYVNYFNGTTWWSGWREVPGHGFTIDSPAAQGEYLFVRGTNNRIYVNTQIEVAPWSGWSEVPGHGLTLSGPTAAFSTVSGGTFLNLFVRGTNNHLYVNRLSNFTTWSGWREVPGHGLTPSAPAATSGLPTVNAGNTLYLFDRGTDNKIYVNTFNGATWSGWSEVAGNGFTPDAPGAMAFATSASVGQVDLFVRGTNDRIYMNSLRFG